MSLDFDHNDVLHGGTGEAFVLVGGAAFATGLIWRRIEQPSAPKPEVRNGAASAGGADLHALIRAGEIVGFAATSRGHRKDMPVLAGVIDGVQGGGNWFGVFDLGGDLGYYVAAMQGGAVVEDGVFTRKQVETRGTRILHSATGQWEAIYAPVDFSYDGSTEVSLAELIGKTRKPRLKPVAGGGKKIALILLVLLLAGGGYGYTVYQDMLAAEEEARLRAELEANLAPRKEVEIPPAPWVIKALVPGGDLLKACSEVMSGRLLAVAGWDVKGIVCTKGGATQTLSREALGSGGAPLTWIRDSIESAGVVASVSPSGGDVASISYGLPREIDPIGADVDRVRLSDAQRFLLTSFEHAFIPIQFGAPQGDNFFSSQSFAFETRFDPATFSDIFDLIPTLGIDMVEYAPETGVYKVAGSFHEALEVNVNAVR